MLLPLLFLVAPVARCFLAPAPRVSVSRLSGAASDSEAEADVSSLRAQLERSLLASADAAADLGGGRAEEALGGGDRAVAMSGTARRRRATERGLVERLGAARDADEFSAAVDALWRLWFGERGAANREALEAVDGSAAHAYGVLPLRVEAGTLVVALADPMNSAVIQDLAFTTGFQVRFPSCDSSSPPRAPRADTCVSASALPSPPSVPARRNRRS